MNSPTNLKILPLHTHTVYSLLDAVSDVKQYVEYCSKEGIEACSCTDHGYVMGLYDLITECKGANIKGIPGLEAYLMPHKDYEYDPDKKKMDFFHLTLWAQNQVGYQNLLSLSNASWGPGRVVKKFGQPKPRITWEDLEDYNEGLICGSGCIEGPIVKPWLRGEKKMSEYGFSRLVDIFGKDRLYMEVMPHSVDRDWTTKNVIQVENSRGIVFTFKDTDIIDTDLGEMTAKDACEQQVGEIYSSITPRPQSHPFSERVITDLIDSDEGDDVQEYRTTQRNLSQ